MGRPKIMEVMARESFAIDAEISETFRQLAAARGIKKADLFRELILRAAEENKELLKKWRELQALRPK